jgi:hypothetical protein
MLYYPVVKRYGDETYDLRAFVRPVSFSVLSIAQQLLIADKQTFIENSWNWVITNIKYPYFKNELSEVFDRHYMEGYLKPNSTSGIIKTAIVNGLMLSAARILITGALNLTPLTITKDFLIGNGIYSVISALVYNSHTYSPAFTYEQFDFWNFPEETIRDMTGDCEDASILLCSILRNALSENEVFVTVGFFENIGHAWVTIFNNVGQPIVLETTGDNILRVSESIIEQPPYYPLFRFNDINVIKIMGGSYTQGTTKKSKELEKIKALTRFYVLKNDFFVYQ